MSDQPMNATTKPTLFSALGSIKDNVLRLAEINNTLERVKNALQAPVPRPEKPDKSVEVDVLSHAGVVDQTFPEIMAGVAVDFEIQLKRYNQTIIELQALIGN